jgi:hypothetical protein
MIRRSLSLLIIALGIVATSAWGTEILHTDNASVRLDGRIQVLGFAQYLDDIHRSDARLYAFLKQARLGVSADYNDYRFALSMAFGGEEEVRAPSPGVSLGLLDAYADIPVPWAGPLRLRAGQFKVPYSRERLLESGNLRYAERSIQNLGFRMGRDIGVALHTQTGSLAAGLGVFVGGGRDVPERYLPQRLGTPLLVLRAGYNDGIDEDVFGSRAAAPRKGLRSAVYANALYVKDSLVGHSSVFNVKPIEKTILTNSSWNPYIGRSPLSQGELWQAGIDAALRVQTGPGDFSAEIEANYGRFSNSYGKLRLAGARGQLGYAWTSTEIGLRYAVLFPDPGFASGGVAVTGSRPIQELTPSLTYFFKERWLKVIVDLPVLIGAPVVMENNVGAYVLTEQPDQASLLKATPPAVSAPGTVSRQTVVEGRLLLQASF